MCSCRKVRKFSAIFFPIKRENKHCSLLVKQCKACLVVFSLRFLLPFIKLCAHFCTLIVAFVYDWLLRNCQWGRNFLRTNSLAYHIQSTNIVHSWTKRVLSKNTSGKKKVVHGKNTLNAAFQRPKTFKWSLFTFFCSAIDIHPSHTMPSMNWKPGKLTLKNWPAFMR